jgi:DNA-binding IclR family transcriptional regulator
LSELFRIVVVMERRQWLQKDPESARYSVTYRLLELAHRGTRAQAMSLIAAPIMSELCRHSEQSCHLVVSAGGHGLVILRQESIGHAGGFAMRLGAVVDLVGSCAGHVLLAFADLETRDAILRRIAQPWPMRKDKLLQRLERVRRQGYELQPSSIGAGVTEISFPIHAREGKVVAALTIPYLPVPANPRALTPEQLRGPLEDAARRISQALALIR